VGQRCRSELLIRVDMFSANTTQVSSGGYQISRSLRFNEPDTAYLSRTPASSGNRKTYTFSAWIKRSKTGSDSDTIISSWPSGNQFRIFFRTDSVTDTLRLFSFDGTFQFQLITTQVFRDFSAWGHLVIAFDTTQATAANRVRVYWNGVEITAFSTATYPTQNTDLLFNQGSQPHGIGATQSSPVTGYYNGYMTEFYFVDGTQLTPSSFGETNAQTGVWQPKAYSGSYGTNGFYLNFSDNSNTTAATLGKDYSGNGNNWTPNNFSVTAGAGNDSLVDSPTSYGTDTGVGGTVRGNYCTLNPLNAGSTATLSNGNLDITGTIAATTSLAYSTIGVSSGKWYWEVTPLTGDHMIGIGKDGGRYDWQTTNGYSYFGNNGQKYTNSAGSAYGATYTNNDVIGVALDMDAGTLTFYKNGTSQGTAFSGLTGTWFPIAQNPGSPLTETFNFGQRPFAYTAPSGFKALCTQNLPTPTIGATTATQANLYFTPTLFTGTGSSRTITTGMQSDMIWSKSRSQANNNIIFDVVRGASRNIQTNNTSAEAYDPGYYVTAFNSDGFNIGGSDGNLNSNGQTYVSWVWRANGSGSTNTSGSITSTVSANTTSGFSVVTFTASANSGSIGHGLGVAPSMIILKSRNNTSNWVCYHASLGADKYILLESTGSAVTNTSTWQNTTPTSTVFYSNGPFVTGYTEVAYCFAEVAGYSKFGSYTGNGSTTDGVFIYTGFRPKYIMFKGSSVTTNWSIFDTSRSPYNLSTQILAANDSLAEFTTADSQIDILSNGIKIRSTTTTSGINQSGATYIFAAFAETPLKYALAR